MFKNKLLYLFIMLSSLLFSFDRHAAVSLQNLRVELLNNPEGIDVLQPRLSWEILSDRRSTEQTAYQILVASTKEKLAQNDADLWNSGKITSDKSVHVRYTGKPLQSRRECFWKVKVWTNKGESSWSEPAYWSIGLVKKEDWKGEWIGLDSAFAWDSVTQFARLSARYLRKEFAAPKDIKKAKVYIAGLGLYELYINGRRVGDHVLAPAPTDYSQSVLYNSFDVTELLQKGRNAVATVLGNGRFFAMRQNYKPKKWHTFGFPKMLLQLELEYNDGTKSVVTSDATWKVTSDGPIRTNNEYDGEEYNALKELTGWNGVGYTDQRWLAAQLVKAPGGKLEAQMNEPMKVMATVKPVSIKSLKPNVYILDMGQNMAGWLQLKVKGKKGDAVKLRFAESLQSNGELYTANLRDAKVTDTYTLKGEGEEVWEPSFVYHGFRYVEITNYPGTPSTNDFEGKVVYDALQTVGSFETSNATINGIHRNAYWGILSNYKGMPVDCPQRNERQPWLGDRSTGAYGESFLFDNGKLYLKWLDDIQQSQTAEGSIPDVAPSFWYYYKDNMTWPGTYLMIADMLVRQYGDYQHLVKHYSSMQKWLGYMKNKYMKNYIITKDSYGDWCVPPESLEMIRSKDSLRNTDPGVIATSYYYYMLSLMQRFATLLNKREDIQAYQQLAVKIREAFNAKYFNKQTAKYSNNTVTANILPLSFGMVPNGYEKKVFQNIADKIAKENGGHISTGVIGTQWLMRGLTNNGSADLAYQLATNKTYPSWGYMLENGATTIWELWNGNTAAPNMNSQNHVMLLGDLIVWWYENLAGIKSDETAPGFKQIIMKPLLPEGLDFVKASYQSVHGAIKSNWKKDGEQFHWNISVPANTKAKVYLPATDASGIKEGGKNITGVDGVKVLGLEKGRVVLEVGSGNYGFSVNNYRVVKK